MTSRIKVDMDWRDRDVDLVRQGAYEGLNTALEYLLEESNKIVPHDEGILQLSGAVSVDAQAMEGVVSYDTPYAARLHEHPEYRFQKGRKGKWLEITFKEKGSVAVRLVKQAIERKLGDRNAD